MSLNRTSIIVGLVVTFFVAVWGGFTFIAQAGDDHIEQIEIAEAVKILTAIHSNQARTEEMCKAGIIKPEFCSPMLTPAIAAVAADSAAADSD